MSKPTVLNAHHLGGIDKIPPTALYVGRPTKYGNIYSSKSGKYSRLECVALHRIWLYRTIIENPGFLQDMILDMKDKDLVCTCKQPKRYEPCHADNYIHVLKPTLSDRLYDKSVLSYIAADLRAVLERLIFWVDRTVSENDWLRWNLRIYEIRLEIQFMLVVMKRWELDPEVSVEYIAPVVIELEVLEQSTSEEYRKYHLDHVSWYIASVIYKTDNKDQEPKPPHLINKLPKKNMRG